MVQSRRPVCLSSVPSLPRGGSPYASLPCRSVWPSELLVRRRVRSARKKSQFAGFSNAPACEPVITEYCPNIPLLEGHVKRRSAGLLVAACWENEFREGGRRMGTRRAASVGHRGRYLSETDNAAGSRGSRKWSSRFGLLLIPLLAAAMLLGVSTSAQADSANTRISGYTGPCAQEKCAEYVLLLRQTPGG